MNAVYPLISQQRRKALPVLEKLLIQEPDARVALEAAGTAAALGSTKSQQHISDVLWSDERQDLSMEAILILTELKTHFARDELLSAAHSEGFAGDERRQAAIWGLGKAGLKSYAELIPFIADGEENAAYHAITAFGPDTPQAVIDSLVSILYDGDEVKAPAASEALRVIGSGMALETLINAIKSWNDPNNWILATIGRFPPAIVRQRLSGTPLIDRLAPMLLVAEGANWLSQEDTATDLAFLLKQSV